jgi:hypothetical protein
MEQLLSMTFCESPAELGVSIRTHRRKNGRKNRRMDGHIDFYVEKSVFFNMKLNVFSQFFTWRIADHIQ